MSEPTILNTHYKKVNIAQTFNNATELCIGTPPCLKLLCDSLHGRFKPESKRAGSHTVLPLARVRTAAVGSRTENPWTWLPSWTSNSWQMRCRTGLDQMVLVIIIFWFGLSRCYSSEDGQSWATSSLRMTCPSFPSANAWSTLASSGSELLTRPTPSRSCQGVSTQTMKFVRCGPLLSPQVEPLKKPSWNHGPSGGRYGSGLRRATTTALPMCPPCLKTWCCK